MTFPSGLVSDRDRKISIVAMVSADKKLSLVKEKIYKGMNMIL